jgi:hypothetical protein
VRSLASSLGHGRRDGAALLRALAIFASSALAGAGVVYWQHAPPARAAATIVKEFDALHSPGFSMQYDTDEFDRRLRAVLNGQDALAIEMYRAYPKHAETPRMLTTRWCNQLNYFHTAREVLDETQRIDDAFHALPVGVAARIANADAAIRIDELKNDEVFARIEALAEHAHDEPVRIADLFQQFARRRIADPARQRELFERAATFARFDASAPADDYRDRLLRVLDHVGRPIALDFDDALGGARWKLGEQRGHWVLVHCSDLNRWDVQQTGRDDEANELKSLEPALQNLDVVLVTVNEAVSSDTLDAVRSRARASQVDWPVFFERDDGEHTWKSHLGINEQVVYLLVDSDGKLAAVCARPKPLVEMLRTQRGSSNAAAK